MTRLLDYDINDMMTLCRVGEMIKVATREQSPITHPTMDYPGPDILVWTQVSQDVIVMT